MEEGGLQVRGLVQAEAIREPIQSAKNQLKWRWLKLETGQALLIKRRAELVHARERPALPPEAQSETES